MKSLFWHIHCLLSNAHLLFLPAAAGLDVVIFFIHNLNLLPPKTFSPNENSEHSKNQISLDSLD